MSESGASPVVSAVLDRYRDAYVVGRTINGVGGVIKAIGIAAGLIIVLGSLGAASKGGSGVLFAIIGITGGGVIATALYILGTLASAQGQILKATLDTAVNSSPFLSDQDRARIMSLPIPAAAGGTGAALARPTPATEWICVCGQRNPAGTSACLDCGIARGAA